MGDMGTSRKVDAVESLLSVFRIINAYPQLADELFCVLMKQLTKNRVQKS